MGGDALRSNTDQQQADELFSDDSCSDLGWYGDGTCDRFCRAPDPDCGDPSLRPAEVITEIEDFNASIPTRQDKYCKMATSAFVFYRGTDHLYWKDLATDRRLGLFGGERTKIWLQGDLHAYNFGSFDNDDDIVVYDLNDFDEVVIADYQMDLWRMATSLVLIARDNGELSSSDVADILDAFSESYLDTVASYRGNNDERGMYYDAQATYGRLDNFLEDVESTESRREMLDKWTIDVGSTRDFNLTLEKLAAVDPAVDAEIRAAMDSYRATVANSLQDDASYFEVKDIALRLGAGTGSLGVPRYYVLIEGKTSGDNDDRILDVKQQGLPSAYPYLSASERSMLDQFDGNQAQRTIVGYRALAVGADDHLGWMSLSDGVYSVRERSPYKEAFPTETLDTNSRFLDMAEQWGAILATAHARSDKDYDSSYISYSFDKQVDLLTDHRHSEFRSLVREVAEVYADQVADDYLAFTDHIAGLCQ